MRILLQRVTSLRRLAQANAPAASYWLCYVLNEDESIVKGVLGAKPAVHHCLALICSTLMSFCWCHSDGCIYVCVCSRLSCHIAAHNIDIHSIVTLVSSK